MRCQWIGAAVTGMLLVAACGGSDGSAGAGSMEASASQPESSATTGSTATSAGGTSASSAPAANTAGRSATGPGNTTTTSTTPTSNTTMTTGTAGVPASASGSAGAPAMAAAAGAQAAAAGDGAAAAAGMGAAPMTDECDRACLLDVMQQYLDALIAHDSSTLKLASSVKVTSNGVNAELEDGLFMTGTMVLDDHRLDYADPVVGNVGTQVVINEGSTGVIYMVRLKVEKHEITEVETMTVRRQGAANGFFNIDNMKPEAVFLEEIPAEKRMSRDELEAITQLYLDYLEGKKRGPDVPFDEGCKRYENGQVTASGLSSFNAQSWGFQVTRRILVIDEEAGITWGMFPFFPSESTLVVGEAFKIIDGKIMMIQAVMANQPAKAWD